MAADYSRPASGFNFKFGGQNTRSPADKLQEDRYPVAQNVRAYDDTTIRTRPGMQIIANSETNAPVTALRAYAALGTDNVPRYLFKSDDSIFLDNSDAVDSGYAPGLGASMIPYRPNQSPESYMYIGDKNQYRKLSAPDAMNVVIAQKAGVAEPQKPVDACISEQQFSYSGLPSPVVLGFTPTGTAGSLTSSDRITDNVEGVFPDTTSLGITTLQVNPTTSDVPAGIYKLGGVTAYFWPHANNGVFAPVFPLDPATATATETGNSLNFNYPGFTEPSFQPMRWAIISGTSVSSSFIPWADANKDYDMVVLASLYVPVAGNYTININHDDGMFFAIGGANFVSGPINDPVGHTKTAVSGLTFASGAVIAGTNQEGAYTEVFVVNFPAPGVYPIEVDYNQRTVYQEMNVLYNGSNLILDAGSSPGYQRYMALDIDNGDGGQTFTVQDVFPPLPDQLAIESIYYYTGSTGRCVIVPASLSPVPGSDGQSLYEPNILSGIRRGSLIEIGSEICLVLNVSNGPTGNVCFETTTTESHTSAENLVGVSAISVFDKSSYVTVGSAISSQDYEFTVGTGIGAVSSPVISTPFVINNFSFQPEDYIHISVNVDTLSNLTEMKLLFDVSDSTFTRNFYYYSIRPNDIVAGIANDLTQLGVSQLVTQRATIDEEQADESGNQGFTASSSQTTTGDSQWSEILFPISSLTRVGNDQSKSLQNTVAVQALFNCSGPITVQMNSISVIGGFAPDVGDVGAPYQYVIRARSSVTGARSNPCPPMRYGVTSRRGQVGVIVPNSYPPEPQADQWDIFRLGGAVTNYTYIGSVPIGTSTIFQDTYSDTSIVSSEQAEYDNFEPWPTVDIPLNALAASFTGSTAIISITDPATQQNVLRYLPGNLVQLAQQVYRLWTRPTHISADLYLFQFVENAGSGTFENITISEPAMANQILPYLWGPTEEGGNVFGCGDPARPGFVYFCKNFQPDSAPDKYNLELCPPSEPLLGGETLNGNSYVASTMRWWQMRPSFGGENQYTPIEAPVGRGLAAPYGHCSDGSRIFFVAKDGVYVHSGGAGESLTDADYYNIFPHEGVAGTSVTYNGITTYAPDYGRAETFRLAYCNNYLFFDYQDSTGTPRNMVFDVRHRGWSTDINFGGIGASIHYNVEQQEGSLGVGDNTYGLLIIGSANGEIFREKDNAIDGIIPIQCILATREMTAGDERAQKLFGDVFLDFTNPTSAVPSNFSVQVMNLGQSVETVPMTQGSGRQQLPIDLNGGEYLFSLGLFMTWTAGVAGVDPVTLYTWQPSYVSKPELTTGRDTDFDDLGYPGNKWIQGFRVESITPNAKQIGVRNADTNTLQQVFSVTSPLQDWQPFSFTQPFYAHEVRIEPQDSVPWTMFKVEWVWEPAPDFVTTWWSQGSNISFPDYGHVYNMNVAYAAGSEVLFTMFFDGKQQDYTLPSTGGQHQKMNLNLMANKGKIYSFRFQSSSGNKDLQIWLQDCYFQVGSWDRTDAYLNYAKIGGNRGDGAKL